MSIEYEIELREKVNNFICRAGEVFSGWSESNDNGEWEIGLYEFEEMCEVIFSIIENSSSVNATEQMLNDMLFGIARDNECSRIINMLIDYPEWYSVLCKKSLSTDYLNAKWQFAESLKDYRGQGNIQELIYEFINVDDEYTERLALLSLAHICPEKAEKYAINFWNRDKYKNTKYEDEYQKIAVLHVLHTIRSGKLKEYLDLADKMEYCYLKANSKEIREKMSAG